MERPKKIESKLDSSRENITSKIVKEELKSSSDNKIVCKINEENLECTTGEGLVSRNNKTIVRTAIFGTAEITILDDFEQDKLSNPEDLIITISKFKIYRCYIFLYRRFKSIN